MGACVVDEGLPTEARPAGDSNVCTIDVPLTGPVVIAKRPEGQFPYTIKSPPTPYPNARDPKVKKDRYLIGCSNLEIKA